MFHNQFVPKTARSRLSNPNVEFHRQQLLSLVTCHPMRQISIDRCLRTGSPTLTRWAGTFTIYTTIISHLHNSLFQCDVTRSLYPHVARSQVTYYPRTVYALICKTVYCPSVVNPLLLYHCVNFICGIFNHFGSLAVDFNSYCKVYSEHAVFWSVTHSENS